MRASYREISLIERLLAPITRTVIAGDAIFIRFWMRTLVWCERFVEREMVSGAAFILSAIAGMMFVIKTAAQRPELHYSREDILTTCIAMSLAIMLLRFVCGYSARKVRGFSMKTQRQGMAVLQPFRASTFVAHSAITGFGLFQIGKYYSGAWYLDGYFYLIVSVFFSITGIYTHSALVYLNLADKISSEKNIRLRKLTGAKQ